MHLPHHVQALPRPGDVLPVGFNLVSFEQLFDRGCVGSRLEQIERRAWHFHHNLRVLLQEPLHLGRIVVPMHERAVHIDGGPPHHRECSRQGLGIRSMEALAVLPVLPIILLLLLRAAFGRPNDDVWVLRAGSVDNVTRESDCDNVVLEDPGVAVPTRNVTTRRQYCASLPA